MKRKRDGFETGRQGDFKMSNKNDLTSFLLPTCQVFLFINGEESDFLIVYCKENA
jgi:hypothetical protein